MTCGYRVSCRQDRHLNSPAGEEWIATNEDRIDARLNKTGKGRVDIAFAARIRDRYLAA
jgi:hypothetical protein